MIVVSLPFVLFTAGGTSDRKDKLCVPGEAWFEDEDPLFFTIKMKTVNCKIGMQLLESSVGLIP